MATIYRLTDKAHDLVDDEFMRGDRDLTEEEIENAREELDMAPTRFDIDGLRTIFDAVMGDERVEHGGVVINGTEFNEGDAKIDAAVAAEVSKHLDMTREQAAHDGLWRYLAVVEFPDFVRYRWPYPSSDRSANSMRDKFLKHSRDIYEQALVRLWWIAELTRDGSNYDLTVAALESQELANDVFDRGFARYPPAVRACVAELRDARSQVVSKTTTRLNHALSTVRLEALDESDLREMVRTIRADVEGSQ